MSTSGAASPACFIRAPNTVAALHLGADGSAGLKGFDQVPVLNKAFDIVTMPALMLPLCIGKDDHENQGH